MTEPTTLHQPLYLPTYDQCYVCGQNHPRGLRTRFFTGVDGQVHANFTPDHTQTGYDNIVHGGVISALLDEILGWPMAVQTGRMFFTGELTVRFLRPVLAGRIYPAPTGAGIGRARATSVTNKARFMPKLGVNILSPTGAGRCRGRENDLPARRFAHIS